MATEGQVCGSLEAGPHVDGSLLGSSRVLGTLECFPYVSGSFGESACSPIGEIFFDVAAWLLETGDPWITEEDDQIFWGLEE